MREFEVTCLRHVLVECVRWRLTLRCAFWATSRREVRVVQKEQKFSNDLSPRDIWRLESVLLFACCRRLFVETTWQRAHHSGHLPGRSSTRQFADKHYATSIRPQSRHHCRSLSHRSEAYRRRKDCGSEGSSPTPSSRGRELSLSRSVTIVIQHRYLTVFGETTYSGNIC